MIIPIIINKIGVKDYGYLVATLNVILILSSLDFGIGNMLMGETSVFLSKKKNQLLGFLLTSITVMFSLIFLLIVLCFIVSLATEVNVLNRFGDSGNLYSEKQFMILVMCIGLNNVLSSAIKILFGLSMTKQAYFFSFLAATLNPLSLGALVILNATLFQIIIGQLLFSALSGVLAFSYLIKVINSLNLGLPRFDYSYIRFIVTNSLLFQFIQLTAIFFTSVYPLIALLLLDAESASKIAILWKCTSLPLSLVSILTITLWPKVAENRDHLEKVPRMLRGRLASLLPYSLLYISLFIIFREKIFILLGAGEINISLTSLLLSVGNMVLLGICTVLSYALNGLLAKKLFYQIIPLNIFCLLSITYVATPLYGIDGIFISSMVSNLFFNLLPSIYWLKKSTKDRCIG